MTHNLSLFGGNLKASGKSSTSVQKELVGGYRQRESIHVSWVPFDEGIGCFIEGRLLCHDITNEQKCLVLYAASTF